MKDWPAVTHPGLEGAGGSVCILVCSHTDLVSRELPWCDGKESTYNAGGRGLILGLGTSPEEENGNPSSVLAWRTEEPGGLQFTELQRVD